MVHVRAAVAIHLDFHHATGEAGLFLQDCTAFKHNKGDWMVIKPLLSCWSSPAGKYSAQQQYQAQNRFKNRGADVLHAYGADAIHLDCQQAIGEAGLVLQESAVCNNSARLKTGWLVCCMRMPLSPSI